MRAYHHPRVAIISSGCRANKSDEAQLRGALAAYGYDIVEESPFDVIILNACTVTQTTDQDTVRLIRRLHREHAQALLVLTGCLAQAGKPEQLAALPLTLVVGTMAQATLAERLNEVLQRAAPAPTSTDIIPQQGQHTRFFFKIQDGCDVRCSFCIIPDARGPARSLDEASIVRALEQAEARGIREVILAGIQLGSWGSELTLPHPKRDRLAQLLQRILRATSLPRIRLGSIEPWSVRTELMELLASERRLLPSLHLPLQSGSEQVLRRMARPLKARDYAQKVQRLVELCPELTLWVDVMTGFPGETEAEFEESYRFIEALPFTRLHVFPYSERPGTPAADFRSGVPVPLRQERARKLQALSNVRFFQRLSARLGSEDEVLVEADLRGHTRDNLPVSLALRGGSVVPERGSIIRVKLERMLDERLSATILGPVS